MCCPCLSNLWFFFLPSTTLHSPQSIGTSRSRGGSKIQWRQPLEGKTECVSGLKGPWDRIKWWKKSCMDPNIRYLLGFLESLRIERGTLILLSSYIPGSTEQINVIPSPSPINIKRRKRRKKRIKKDAWDRWSKTTLGQLCRCSLCQLEYQWPPQCSCAKILHKSLWLELSSGLTM